ncbi:MAG: HlyD family efflux transporter periplasmic adaptor subunit [Geminicoccaceae bacterium]
MSADQAAAVPPRRGGRMVRLLAGAALLLVALGIYLPQLTHSVSREAVLNTPLVAVRSPIAGTVSGPAPVAGTVVRAGEPLLRVENPRVDAGRLGQLELEAAALHEKVVAGEHEEAELDALAGELTRRLQLHRQATAQDLTAEARQLVAAGESAAARVAEREAAMARLERLGPKGVATQADLDQVRAELVAARAELARLGLERERVEARQAALADGTYLGADRNDVPYSQQRLDEVRLRRIELASELARDRSALAAQTDAVEAERRHLDQLVASDLVAPVDGVVVRPAVVEGGVVEPDRPLLWVADCSAPFVTARLSDRYYETVRPGAEATVRLLRQDSVLHGKVESVRGIGDPSPDGFAAAIEGVGDGRFVAVIRLDREAALQVRDAGCEIGAWAEVRFEREMVMAGVARIGRAMAALIGTETGLAAQVEPAAGNP